MCCAENKLLGAFARQRKQRGGVTTSPLTTISAPPSWLERRYPAKLAQPSPPARPRSPSPSGYLPPVLQSHPSARRLSTSSSATDLSSSSSSSWDSDRQAYEDQLQWEESIRQLQLIWSVVALPFAAKWLGRKFAYWTFARYLTVGLGAEFWLGSVASLLVKKR